MAESRQAGITTFMIHHQDVFGGKGKTLTVPGNPKIGRIELEPDGENVKLTLYEE